MKKLKEIFYPMVTTKNDGMGLGLTIAQSIVIQNKGIIECKSKNKETIFKNIPSIHIGKIPIMLKSNICVLKQFSHYNSDITKECDHDPGGYFIINGSEKTCLGQERAAENQIYCFNISKYRNLKFIKNQLSLSSTFFSLS